MNTLEKYRSAWKNESSFTDSVLTNNEIKSYLSRRSVHMDRMYRSGILFDLVLKIVLAAGAAGIVILYRASQGSWLIGLVLGILLLVTFLYERKVYRRIPHIASPTSSLKEALQERITFFNKSYLKALLVMAISNPVLILTGGIYYFYFKYGGIRPLDVEDIIVFSLFLIAGYFLMLVFQMKNFRFHIGQLEVVLTEFEEESVTQLMLNTQRKKRNRIMIMTGLAVITGILLFLLLLL